jgi:hypothetical protein
MAFVVQTPSDYQHRSDSRRRKRTSLQKIKRRDQTTTKDDVLYKPISASQLNPFRPLRPEDNDPFISEIIHASESLVNTTLRHFY